MNRKLSPILVLSTLLLAIAVAGGYTATASAQTIRRGSTEGKTTVSLVLITGDNTAAFRARSWRTTLEKLNVSFRIRGGTAADKLEIRERKLGPLRQVTVVGKVDRSGRLIFADRTFTRDDAAKLGEWIRELKTYGKQGQPHGKPLWGLSKAQFGDLFADLSTAAESDVSGKTLDQAATRLRLPAKYAVRYSVAARSTLSKGSRSSAPVRKQVKGHSLGTAFSLILRDYGLGFRPLRNPKGDIELVVDPLTEAKDAWPIGWKPKGARPATAPKLFKIRPVELNKVKMSEVFRTITAGTGVPIHIDYQSTTSKRIDVDNMVISYPARKASYSLMLRGITTRKKLSYVLRIDEAGRPFAWITAWAPGSSDE